LKVAVLRDGYIRVGETQLLNGLDAGAVVKAIVDAKAKLASTRSGEPSQEIPSSQGQANPSSASPSMLIYADRLAPMVQLSGLWTPPVKPALSALDSLPKSVKARFEQALLAAWYPSHIASTSRIRQDSEVDPLSLAIKGSVWLLDAIMVRLDCCALGR
jgi:hypothetical protein